MINIAQEAATIIIPIIAFIILPLAASSPALSPPEVIQPNPPMNRLISINKEAITRKKATNPDIKLPSLAGALFEPQRLLINGLHISVGTGVGCILWCRIKF